MQGYIFEVTNKKTGETYLGKVGAVVFNKDYFGEENNERLAVAIERFGRPSFEVRMLMPYETLDDLEAAFESMKSAERKAKKAESKKAEPKKVEKPKVEEPKVEESKVEEPVKEVKAPAKRGRKKAVEAE